MELLFTPSPPPILSQQRQASPSAQKKPRAPPRFSQHRSATRRWQSVESTDAALHAVAAALAKWNARTGHAADVLPSDSHLRRCDVARELRLQSLIVRAGGYRAVQHRLGLHPIAPPGRVEQERQLVSLAECLALTLEEAGYPAPEQAFPDKRLIRKLAPQLGNRIAAFPGRNGYKRLEAYVKDKKRGFPAAEQTKLVQSGKWRVWTHPQAIRSELLAYQLHPQVLPRLNSLSTELSSAIQRQGGAATFAQSQGMVLEKDWVNITRLARIVRCLADEVWEDAFDLGTESHDVERYMDIVRYQVANPPPFPCNVSVSRAGLSSELQRFGGRKSLAIRLGFARFCGIRDVFLGPFSVQYAADILDFASRQVYVRDGNVAMPTVDTLKASERHDLAEATAFFGGEESVGRRVGLVPQE